MDNELMLYDRLEVIRATINKYGEENFYISFSGGKDSTVLSELIDLALPNNRIPRVFINTGIEYRAIVEYVKERAESDSRFVLVAPSKNIRQTLKEKGYPFKSKEHSVMLYEWQKGHRGTMKMNKYLNGEGKFTCPKMLKYQFTDDFTLKVSALCCNELKKKPAKEYAKQTGRKVSITGMMRTEGGERTTLNCVLLNKKGKIKKFNPMAVVTNDWEEWFIERQKIKLCELYYPPYNFKRTGCKGCPYALTLQEQLTIMSRYMPEEREQCEVIWKPVYDEYRRLGYRLDKAEQTRLI